MGLPPVAPQWMEAEQKSAIVSKLIKKQFYPKEKQLALVIVQTINSAKSFFIGPVQKGKFFGRNSVM